MLISWHCFVHMECYVLLLWKRAQKREQSADVLSNKPWDQTMNYTGASCMHVPYKMFRN